MDDDDARPGGSSELPKMLIPRLNRPPPQPKPKPEVQRVSKACLNCRKRKVKCTGESPSCSQCENGNLTCTYEPHRKDRLKIQTERNRSLVTLLRDLSLRVSIDDRDKISRVLEGADSDEGGDLTPTISRDEEARSTSSHERIEYQSTNLARRSSVPSISLDYTRILSITDTHPPPRGPEGQPQPGGPSGTLDEDLLRSRSSRETGFIGPMSEIHWLRIFLNQKPPARLGTIGALRNTMPHHMESYNYYVDDVSFDLETFVDPHELPDGRTARQLFSYYSERVQTSFPILPATFEDQFEKLFHSIEMKTPIQPPSTWAALLNLTFAIGAVYARLIDAEWQGDGDDHKVYLARASQLLDINKTILFLSAPDGTMIQALGLLSFYFLVIGHVGRAWSMIGMSLRSAMSVGLHLRSGDASVQLEKRQSLVRTWWALYSIESALSSMTGRPSVIANEHIAVPLPHNVYRGQYRGAPADELPFLDAHITIGLITQDVLTHLYSRRMEVSSSGQMQIITAALTTTLNDWAIRALPQYFREGKQSSDESLDRGQRVLFLRYYRARILIARPSLQRLNAHTKDRSGESPEVMRRMAAECVQAALDMTAMLQDPPTPRWIYETGPWWSIVHSIMQALTVLIMEMTYGNQSHGQDTTAVGESIKKLLGWLRSMRAKNAVAKRAYDLISSILLDAEPPTLSSIRDFLLEDTIGRPPAHSIQAPHGFPQYGYSTAWSSIFGAETSADVQGQDHLDYSISPPPMSGMAATESSGDMYPADVWYMASGAAALSSAQASFPLPTEPGAELDILADPWSAEEANMQANMLGPGLDPRRR